MAKQASIVSEYPDYYHEVFNFRKQGVQVEPIDEICQKFVPSKDEMNAVYNTPLARLLSKKQLPFAVKVTRSLDVPGKNKYGINLKAGGMLMLHFIVRPKRVFATDPKREGVALPIHAEQLYEVLPTEPAHDDKMFQGTAEVMKTNPLPMRLRIIDAIYSNVPEEAQEKGEIIEVSHVEKRDGVKVLVGRSTLTKQNFAFPEHMQKSTYSAMISENHLTLSAIIRKFKLPLRVRKVGEKKSVYLLNEVRKEAQVICTDPQDNHVFAMALTCPVHVDCVDKQGGEAIVKATVPQLYPLLNLTWGLMEIGRAPLPLQQQQTPQPLLGVLCHWLNSRDGSELVSMIPGNFSETKTSQSLSLERKKKELERKLTPRPPLPPKGTTVKTSISPTVPPKPLEKKPMPGKNSMRHEAFPPRPSSQLNTEMEKKQKEIENLKKENQELIVSLNKQQEENKALQSNISELLEEICRLKKEDYVVPVDVHTRPDSQYEEVQTQWNFANESVEEVSKFLDRIGLSAYAEKFRKENVDGALLCDLVADGEEIFVTELKMKRLHARKLIVEIKKKM